jgi:hypothetical protein
MRRALTINLDANLPYRARALDKDAIAKVFGGCQQEGERCGGNDQCCSQARQLVCKNSMYVPYRTCQVL